MSKNVVDDKELCITSTVVGRSLSGYDLLMVPGGLGTRTLQYDEGFIDWLRTSEPVKLKTSVCAGALLLGAVGFLKHKRATTHPRAFEELKPYCAQMVDRVVDEGNVVTARGVTTGIDLGLHLIERIAGAETRTRIATQMDYHWQGYAG